MLSRCNNILLSEHIQIYTASRILSLRRWASNIVKSRNWQFSTNSMDGVNRIAIGQMRSTNDKEHNRRQVKEIVERGAAAKACFIFLPECCDFVGNDHKETISLAEPLDGATIIFYKKLAQEHKVWLSLGGIHESVSNETGQQASKMYNSHVILNAAGEIVDVYRKLHLFDVDTPEFKFRESSAVTGGNSIVAPLTETPLGGGLGLLICYDLRFPEVSTILRKKGATILTYPSAFAQSTGQAHWETLLRARAIETQTFVIAAAQIGKHNEKRRSFGRAMVVDPWGRIIAECSPHENIVDCQIATINMKELNDVRSRMPCFEHRRDNIYSVIPARFDDRALVKAGVFHFERHVIPKANIFYESALSVAFTNICCVVPGHVLVASRRCVKRLKDLSTDEVIDFFLAVSKCQRLLEQYYGTNSATITVQDGEFAGQTVKHVHCHIMPRKEGDFEHNDQIYIELNKHDHPDSNAPARQIRPADEMAAEALEYRKLIDQIGGM